MSVHTPAPAALRPHPMAEFEGVLLHNAQARTRVLDAEGHVAPVLCMEVELTDAPEHNRASFEQRFPAGAHTQCAAAARRLKKGMRLTLHATMADLRLLATNTTHVHVHQPEPSTTAGAYQPSPNQETAS